MYLVCSNCGKKEGPTATYCRDCYTVFPFEKRASALKGQERKKGLGYWKLLPVAALFAGGTLLLQLDFRQSAPPEKTRWFEATAAPDRPRPAQSYSTDASEASWQNLRSNGAGHRPKGRGRGVERLKGESGSTDAPSVAARSRYVGWVLRSDSELSCAAPNPCPATIRFSSGDWASYAVERWEGTSNTIVPADEKASRLLNHEEEATLDMKLPSGKTRSVSMERKANQWAFVSGGIL